MPISQPKDYSLLMLLKKIDGVLNESDEENVEDIKIVLLTDDATMVA